MNQPHKTHFIGVLLITFFIIILTAVFLIMKNRNVLDENITVTENKIETTNTLPVIEEKVGCGIVVKSPTVGEKFDVIKKVSVLIDNSKRVELGCGWTVFEGQAGTFKIIDSQGSEVSNGILKVEEGVEWMTSLPVTYEGEVLTSKDEKDIAKGTGKLIITEDDPSGEKIPQTIEILIEF